MIRINKKAISPVVATALFLVVAVVSVVGFQNWFGNYSTQIFSDSEIKSQNFNSIEGIETLVGNNLYIKSGKNTSILKIEIEGEECNFTGNISGVQEIDVSDCIQNVSTVTPEVVVITQNQVISKKIYFVKPPALPNNCIFNGSIIVAHNASAIAYLTSNVPYLGTCVNETRYCDDGVLDGSYQYSTCVEEPSPCAGLLGGEWVLAPAGDYVGQDFCVMKYEARNVGGIATSQALWTPWHTITQSGSKTACNNLGANYHLVSNAEWITMARDIEDQPGNWANGVIGSTISSGGGLKRGNSAVTDSTAYNGPNPDTGASNTKAMHTFSNGEQIWHLSGNMAEWTSDTTSSPSLGKGVQDCYEWPTIGGYSNLKPGTGSWGSTYGAGLVCIMLSGTRPYLWGGTYQSTVTGLYTLSLTGSGSTSDPSIGFRCAYTIP